MTHPQEAILLSQIVEAVEEFEAKKRIPDELPRQTFFGKYDLWYYIAITDSRTCRTCLMLDRSVLMGIDLRLLFPWLEVISSDQMLPMTHPNCRCTLLRVTNLQDYLDFTRTLEEPGFEFLLQQAFATAAKTR